MKNIIIGTIFIMICITVATFFFEMHPELTTPGLNQPIEEHEAQESETLQPSPLLPIYEEESIGYSLQNDQLQITFNKGRDWILVPVEKEKLFAGEYNGNEQELIGNSYTLTKIELPFYIQKATALN
jgi:hypothetical protein